MSFCNGVNENGVNVGRYYAMPPILATEACVEYHSGLILGSSGVCALRDQCIAGQMTVDEFFTRCEALKSCGLQDILDQGVEACA